MKENSDVCALAAEIDARLGNRDMSEEEEVTTPNLTPTPEDLARDLVADLALCEAATAGPWYTVGAPWLPRDCGTYVIAGHPDPHVGEPVLDHIDIDEWPADEDGPDYAQSDANLEFAAAARTGWPAAIRCCLAARAGLTEMVAQLNHANEERIRLAQIIEAQGNALHQCKPAKQWQPAPLDLTAPPVPVHTEPTPAPPSGKEWYAWEMVVTFNNGKPDETVTYVAKNEAQARKKALMRACARDIIKCEGMTEEQYRRVHGSRRRLR